MRSPSGRCCCRLYLPFATCLDTPLEADPFQAPADLYAVLGATHRLHWTDRTSAHMPTPDDAAALDVPEGVPLLVHQRLVLTENSHPLALEQTRLPAHQTRICHDTTATTTPGDALRL
jgi:DNA-binding GntR family transcriptional regulator